MDDELGVGLLEPTGDRASPWTVVEEDNGEAVPEDESFFFDDLLESLALESCSCWSSINMLGLSTPVDHLPLLPEILSSCLCRVDLVLIITVTDLSIRAAPPIELTLSCDLKRRQEIMEHRSAEQQTAERDKATR